MSKGFKRSRIMASRVFGILKGSDWRGIMKGNGGSLEGAGSAGRGASRRGSTCFLNVVNMSGSS